MVQIVLAIRVASVNDAIVRCHQFGQLLNGVVHECCCPSIQATRGGFSVFRQSACETAPKLPSLTKGLDRLTFMLVADESPYHVAAHPPEPNRAELHTHTPCGTGCRWCRLRTVHESPFRL